ncbi:MAG: 16S rRNA (cytidine(1402)-2'-O)-methyltransferase [Candidatus Eisenbacteria bacterium]|nr:16S rRNA (cytidine(1402)-2'-O)-methyltransferase [Candidatus Eisenbacteria bacterium]
MSVESGRGVAGRLFVVATPIGNLADASPRCIDVLRSVDAIAAEDTRRTRKLLSHYSVSGKLIPHHDHNEDRAAAVIVDRILAGDDIALVTDAGTPLIADPGYRLVAACAERGIEVIPVPGPSAVAAAISVAGLPPQPFFFAGYLPRKRSARVKRLSSLSDLGCTVIFYESPHRITAALRDLIDVFGDRRAALARELTKVHEEVLRGRLSELCEIAESRSLKGEIVVLVGSEIGSEVVDT